MPQLLGIFVTGTDTGVGKTWISTAIVESLRSSGKRVGVIKPVTSGVQTGPGGEPQWSDAEALARAVGCFPIERVAPILLPPALAPPVAARLMGQRLTAQHVKSRTKDALDWWRKEQAAELMVVEGVGGLLCPLAEEMSVADLAVELDFPLLIIARRGLGTLNHALLTVEAARSRGLRVAGVILNGTSPAPDPLAEETNPAELARRLPIGIPILASVPFSAGPGLPPTVAGLRWEFLFASSRQETSILSCHTSHLTDGT
jgi:dethiobiotin synthetase